MASAWLRSSGVAGTSGRDVQQCGQTPNTQQQTCMHTRSQLCKRPLRSFTPQLRPVKYSRPSLTVSKQATAEPTKKRGRKPAPAGIPTPGPNQQTLKKSFTVGGLGLHTGEYAYVRVRPALAGEGRYFVRVPEGTNDERFFMDEPAPVEEEEVDGTEEELSEDQQDTQVALFKQFLAVQEGGYEGTFAEFVEQELAQRAQELFGDLGSDDEEEPELEEITPRSDDEVYVQAHINNVTSEGSVVTVLGEDEHRVINVEPLLSALEGFGVDNARIEIEGGHEVPIIDGSALGWSVAIHKAGLRLATNPQHKDRLRRMTRVPKQVVTVREEDAFVTFFPEDTPRLTVGLDHKFEAPVIGKPWLSWSPEEDDHYRWEMASARFYAPSLEWLYAARDAGLVRGGAAGCSIIGWGDRWYEPDQVRYPEDEPARFRMTQLLGALSLLAEGGNAGLPAGHVVAYKASQDLQLRFARALLDSSPDDWSASSALQKDR